MPLARGARPAVLSSAQGERQMPTRRDISRGLVAAAATAPFAGRAFAQQDYPNRPLHVVIGFAAGSGADILCRFFIARLQELSGQSVVIENKPGAVGVIAANI